MDKPWMLRNGQGKLIKQFATLQEATNYAEVHEIFDAQIDTPLNSIEELEKAFREINGNLFTMNCSEIIH